MVMAWQERLAPQERLALAAVVSTIELFGPDLVSILATEGHDHECDALLRENATDCDCWWGKVKAVAESMALVQSAAQEEL
jgi:hypothetical protein